MALRILLPKISAFGLSQITTPEPLSPISKRKLRHLLPSSPVAAPSPQCPPPPREPYPFLWQCCSCYTTYRFSTTRRCLLCSHNYCTREVAFGSSSSNPSSSQTSSGGNGKKRRRRNKYCRTEFDYEGWAAWGAWRRGHALGIESTREADADAELKERERKFVKKTHDCFAHCDFPSQCFHTQIRVLEDELRGEEERAAIAKVGVGEILGAYAVAPLSGRDVKAGSGEVEDEDRLELNLARDLPEDDEETSPFFYDERKSQSNGGSGNGRDITSSKPGYPVVIPGLTTTSPAVDATQLTRDELFALIDEDDDMMAFEDSKAGQRAGASSRLLMRHPHRNNSTERVDWAGDLEMGFLDDLAESGSDDDSGSDEDSTYEYAAEHQHRGRPTSSGSDVSSASASSSEWEDIEDDDEDEEVMEDVFVDAMGFKGVEEEGEEGVPLRDFRGATHMFRIEAGP
ncbi:hypothetical protein PG985_009536 [Apiospora marii]|uniref:Uncharacterized protein n=1 Tax=Apiospora marii TaxID=335849 RepID=A0ABR1RGP5_9PEZI